jgi:hypothetical protein
VGGGTAAGAAAVGAGAAAGAGVDEVAGGIFRLRENCGHTV